MRKWWMMMVVVMMMFENVSTGLHSDHHFNFFPFDFGIFFLLVIDWIQFLFDSGLTLRETPGDTLHNCRKKVMDTFSWKFRDETPPPTQNFTLTERNETKKQNNGWPQFNVNDDNDNKQINRL